MPFDEVEALVKQTLSEEGQYVVVKARRQVFVQDTADRVAMVEALFRDLNEAQPNVRIEVAFAEQGGGNRGGAVVDYQVGGRDFQVGNRPGPRNSVGVQLERSAVTRNVMSNQFLVVQGGQSASIEVGQRVPFVDYFYRYAFGLGLVPAEVRWEAVGTQMSVRPMVEGQTILVEVVPVIRALAAGRWQTLEVRSLATTVRTVSGVPVQIGGFQGAGEEFNRNFFSGISGRGERSSSTFTITATVLP
ncbi:MAG: hypothetical protein OHK005_03420 [Candidatus Methylacidiphilales bacterium]